MASNLPISQQEVLKLTQFELDPKSFKFAATGFESDKYISICDPSSIQSQDQNFSVIELQNNFKIIKKPRKADSVLMNPSQNIIALKAKGETDSSTIIQVFNMEQKVKLNHLEFNETIVFWKWPNDRKLAIVTSTAVYHVDITQQNSSQIKMFERNGDLLNQSVQIIGYCMEQNEQWSALFGISTPDGGKTILGHIQLVRLQDNKYQHIQGHCCCFGQAKVHNNIDYSTLFCFVEKKQTENESKVYITEISQPPVGASKFKKQVQFQLSSEYPSDFPVVMHVSSQYAILYIVTKFGFFYLYEMTSGLCISRTRISNDPIFIGCRNSITDGLLVLSKVGSLISLDVVSNLLVRHVMTQFPQNNDLAMLMAQRYSLPGFDPIQTIKDLIVQDPQAALNFAKGICSNNSNVSVHSIAEIFLNSNCIQQMTAFLVDCMKNNKPEDGPWQTKVLECNLMMGANNVVDTILNMEMWNQFNKQYIANLCEQKGLLQRSLEYYLELKDIRRVILNTHMLNHDWIVGYMSKMQSEWILACLSDMLRHNRQNLQIAVKVVQANYQKLNIQEVLKMFEGVGAFDGIYYFLGSILASTEDKEIHFKYIQSATKCNQLKEVERIIREKQNCYDPEQVKKFLMEQKLSDPKSLIFLCDIHGYLEELTRYLYQNNYNKFIEIFILRVNTNAAPQVLGTLIDLEAEENYIKQILYTMRGNCPIEELIEEFDKRNKLRLLENWLDSRMAEGNQLPSVHNSLAKIKIDTNQDPETFLINNQFYDSKIIGKYCEERDPHLAFKAYKRAWGYCDQELIDVTNKNSLYRLQARYLVERKSLELWAQVLSPENQHRKLIVEQVVTSALPDSKDVEEVQTTVQAFMKADLQKELISLLEKIVLHNQEFGQYKKLQNLLIITAIKTDQSRVMDYIKRLDNYDGPEIAKIALKQEYQLYEEAFEIYRLQNFNVDAIEVLLQYIQNIVRAAEFAEKINQPDVWARLGHSYLEKEQIAETIDCYLKAKDKNQYLQVINISENQGKYEILIKYLLMCREELKDQNIDNSLIFSYAKLGKTAEIEDFVTNTNSADILRVGDRCYAEKLYESARILFTSLKNNAKIAQCLIRLKQFQKAIDFAKKANSPITWKELCVACVEAKEFKLAAITGQNIIIIPDHLEELVKVYEAEDAADEMILLLQQGLSLERAHMGIFTELGVLYAKYHPEKLLEHCKQYFSKLNVSKLLRICEKYYLWAEAVFLHQSYNEFDSAIEIMIEHSPLAWNHDLFVQIIQKVNNSDYYYKGIHFYYQQQPQLLNKMLAAISQKIDLTKCVQVMKKLGDITLIVPFLKSIQSANNLMVNDVLNNLYLESGDYESLQKSIENFENFDASILAQQTQNHELTEFRRIAAFLYRKNGKFEKSLEISQKDHCFKDCIDTAKESQNPQLVEQLMNYFVENQEKEFFTCLLYTCYFLLKPDRVLEIAWRFGLMDFAMPFFIQITKELTTRVDYVQKKHEDREKKEEHQAKQQEKKHLDIGPDIMMTGMGNFMLPPADTTVFTQMYQSMAPPQNSQFISQMPLNQSMSPNMNMNLGFQTQKF